MVSVDGTKACALRIVDPMTTSNPGQRPRRAIVALIIAGILLVADVGAVMALHHRHRERVESVCLSERKLSTDGNDPFAGNGPAFGNDPATGNGPGDFGPMSRRTINGEKCGAFGSRGLAQRRLGGAMFGNNDGNGSTNVPNPGQNTGPNRRYGNGFPPFTAPGSGPGNSTTTTTTTATAPAGVGQ